MIEFRQKILFPLVILALHSVIEVQACNPNNFKDVEINWRTTPAPKEAKRTQKTKPTLRAKFKPKPKTQKTTKTTTTPLPSTSPETNDESRFQQYAKYTQNGFFVEINEDIDNSIRAFKMKKLPPIYSQTFRGARSLQEGSNTEDFIQEITETDGRGTESSVQGAEVLSEDNMVQKDWGGGCFAKHWRYCNRLKGILVMNVYNKTKSGNYETQHMDLDCKIQDALCMKNGWTVNRCQVICMSKCNVEMLVGYDNFVSYQGACKYI